LGGGKGGRKDTTMVSAENKKAINVGYQFESRERDQEML